MSLLEEFIECDKQISNIYNFLNKKELNIYDFLNKKEFNSQDLFRYKGSKIAVFEEANKIYKVLSLDEYKRICGVYCLTNKVFNFSSFILDYKTEYKGENLVIISQEKIMIFNHSRQIKEILQKNNINFTEEIELKSNIKMSNDIVLYLKFLLDNKDFNIFIDIIEFLKIKDFLNIANFGVNKENKILWIDLENFNHEMNYYDLQLFLKKYNKNFNLIVEQFPEILFLIKV